MYEMSAEDPKKYLAPYLSGPGIMETAYAVEMTAPFGDRPKAYRVESGAETKDDEGVVFLSFNERSIVTSLQSDHIDVDSTLGYLTHAKCWEPLEHKVGPALRQKLNLAVESIEAVAAKYAYLGAGACQNRHFWESMRDTGMVYVRDPFIRPLQQTKTHGEDTQVDLIAQIPSMIAKQVPLEIESMVWRQLSFPDLRNFCVAVGRDVPQYWCREIVLSNWKLSYEVSETQAKDLDWQSLCESLGRENPPPSLLNRDRVIRLLEYISDEFNRRTREGKSGDLVQERLLEI